MRTANAKTKNARGGSTKLAGGYPPPPDGWTRHAWARHLQRELAIPGRVKSATVRSMYRNWVEALYRCEFDNNHGPLSPATREAIADGEEAARGAVGGRTRRRRHEGRAARKFGDR